MGTIMRKRRSVPVPAYLDSLNGLMRCEALRLDADGLNVIVRFRGPRLAALGFKGEQPWTRRLVVPRDKVKGNRILPFDWSDYLPEAIRND